MDIKEIERYGRKDALAANKFQRKTWALQDQLDALQRTHDDTRVELGVIQAKARGSSSRFIQAKARGDEVTA